MSQAPHRGLNDFGVVDICCIQRAIDGVYAKPVGYAYDGSQVARILHAVQSQREMTRCLLVSRASLMTVRYLKDR